MRISDRYRKFVVIGATGCGKSTLAMKLAERLELDFIELDALNWGPNWTPARGEVLCARVEAATRSPGWVVAGNYSETRPISWKRAQAVIWLDYSFPVIFWRLLKRTIVRSVTREVLWNGNREKFWRHLRLWSDESLFHWLVKTYGRRKREYPQLFAQPEYAHLQVIRHRRPQETQEWLTGL